MIALLAALACIACLVGAGLVEARVIKVDRPVPTVGRHRPEVDRAELVADLTAYLGEGMRTRSNGGTWCPCGCGAPGAAPIAAGRFPEGGPVPGEGWAPC